MQYKGVAGRRGPGFLSENAVVEVVSGGYGNEGC